MEELSAHGSAAYAAADYDLAATKWSAALRRRPNDATLLSNRCAAWLALGESQSALEDATRLLELTPHWPKAHARLAAALSKLGRTSEAISAYETAIALQPDQPMYAEELNRLRSASQRHATSSATEVAGDVSGGGAGGDVGGGSVALSGLELARECVKLGRPAQAVRELDKLIEVRRQDGELYCERSIAHVSNERFTLAADDATTATSETGKMLAAAGVAKPSAQHVFWQSSAVVPVMSLSGNVVIVPRVRMNQQGAEGPLDSVALSLARRGTPTKLWRETYTPSIAWPASSYSDTSTFSCRWMVCLSSEQTRRCQLTISP